MAESEAVPKRFSEADVERIVAKRLEERQQADVVAGLAKELNAIRREIGSANHLKREFGKQLADLNALVRAHVAQPMHAGTAEKFTELQNSFAAAEEQFGLDHLTPEERSAFPTVVRTVLTQQKRVNDQKQADKEHAEHDTRYWQRVAALASAAAVIVSLLAAMGFFSWIQINLFHLHR